MFRVQTYLVVEQVRLVCDDKSTSVISTSTSPMYNTKCISCTCVIVRLELHLLQHILPFNLFLCGLLHPLSWELNFHQQVHSSVKCAIIDLI